MKKLIAATLAMMCITVLSSSSNASSPQDTSSTDLEQTQALVQRDVSSLSDTPNADSDQPQALVQRGVCNLTCTSCIIGQPCAKDPDTGRSQHCVPNCP